MLISNHTIRMTWEIQQLWLSWMKEEYLPAVMESGCFTGWQLVRLLEIDEDEGPTYALQLYAESRDIYSRFEENNLPDLEAFVYKKWGDRVLSFSTLMQVVMSKD